MISAISAFGQNAATTVAEKPSVPELFYNPSFYLLTFVFIIMLVVIIALTRTIRLLA